MKQFDQVKLDVAIKYVERIADGCNPVNNNPLDHNDVLKNVYNADWNPNQLAFLLFYLDKSGKIKKSIDDERGTMIPVINKRETGVKIRRLTAKETVYEKGECFSNRKFRRRKINPYQCRSGG